MKKLTIFLYILSLFFTVTSCSIFFEEKLEDELIDLIAPADYLETSDSTQTFIWTSVKGATGYNLMIVSPSFDSISSIILDIDTAATSYTKTLKAGKYQWGVLAYNSSSNTPQYYRDLIILEADTLLQQKDLSNETVQILAPADNFISYTTKVNFYWEKVDSADGYKLRIVSPEFNTIENIVLDSSTTGTSFSRNLEDGTYEWSVKAFNKVSNSLPTIYRLTVNTQNYLSDKKVILETPASGDAFNTKEITLTWKAIAEAESYQVEVHTESWEGDNVIYPVKTSIASQTVSLKEGSYIWGVKALNSYSESDYGTADFVVDLTAPAKPSITVPLNSGDTIKTSPFKLSWTHPVESLSEIYDTLFIASDTLFQSNVEKIFLSEDTSFSLFDFNNGKWFCKVQSVDKAGNASKVSVTKSFYLLK